MFNNLYNFFASPVISMLLGVVFSTLGGAYYSKREKDKEVAEELVLVLEYVMIVINSILPDDNYNNFPEEILFPSETVEDLNIVKIREEFRRSQIKYCRRFKLSTFPYETINNINSVMTGACSGTHTVGYVKIQKHKLINNILKYKESLCQKHALSNINIFKKTTSIDKTNFVLSIVIPCYNEIDSIENIVQRVLNSKISNKEIIIVDDKSTDGTREILKSKIAPLVSQVVYHEKNLGKGAALRTGFQHATGDVVIVQDADLEYDPQEYPQIIMPIVNGETDVCYGSRFLKEKAKGYKANQLANKVLTTLSNFFTHLKLTDMETCYKAFKRDIIQSIDLVEDRFGFEPEVTAKIAKLGVRVKEVPISYNPRSNAEGKKIGIKDGIRAIYCILKYQ